ncbi:hypothetical protein [Streptomyces atratus]|uniref:hypothetical protein n=1 Tax=Streptomyces atratus TaxID=1893 RepID=UPI0037BA37F0
MSAAPPPKDRPEPDSAWAPFDAAAGPVVPETEETADAMSTSGCRRSPEERAETGATASDDAKTGAPLGDTP